MAQNYGVDIQRWNGQDYDTILPTPDAHADTHKADGSDPLFLQTGNYGDKTVTSDKLADAAVVTSKIANNTVTRSKLAADVKVLSFANKMVDVSVWESDSTYMDFPYRASVACSGVTANHYAEVIFSPEDVMSGTFCPVTASYAGGVYVYASEIPSATVTIPTIVCTPTA